jgi:hypothetical protein
MRMVGSSPAPHTSVTHLKRLVATASTRAVAERRFSFTPNVQAPKHHARASGGCDKVSGRVPWACITRRLITCPPGGRL